MPEPTVPAAGSATAAVTTPNATASGADVAAQAAAEETAARESARSADDTNRKPILRQRAIAAERERDSLRAELARAREEAKSGGAFREKYVATTKEHALLSEAQKLGLRNVDYLKLADLSKVTVDEDGHVKGAGDAAKALREKHPDLFGPVKETKPGVTQDKPSAGSTHPDFDPSQDIAPDDIANLPPEKLDAYLLARGLGGTRPQASGLFGGEGKGFVRGNGYGR